MTKAISGRPVPLGRVKTHGQKKPTTKKSRVLKKTDSKFPAPISPPVKLKVEQFLPNKRKFIDLVTEMKEDMKELIIKLPTKIIRNSEHSAEIKTLWKDMKELGPQSFKTHENVLRTRIKMIKLLKLMNKLAQNPNVGKSLKKSINRFIKDKVPEFRTTYLKYKTEHKLQQENKKIEGIKSQVRRNFVRFTRNLKIDMRKLFRDKGLAKLRKKNEKIRNKVLINNRKLDSIDVLKYKKFGDFQKTRLKIIDSFTMIATVLQEGKLSRATRKKFQNFYDKHWPTYKDFQTEYLKEKRSVQLKNLEK
ncbi:hypothetical protein ACFLZV_01420 [Candidatus Margulisiibacteriota bacterium]